MLNRSEITQGYEDRQKNTFSEPLFILGLIVAGIAFVYLWLSFFGNGLEKYTDIVCEYTSIWNSNKSSERTMVYALAVLGAGAMFIYYSYGCQKGVIQPLKELSNKDDKTLNLVMIAMIVASVTGFVVYSNISPILYSVLILAVITCAIHKKSAYNAIVFFVICLYSLAGIYRLYVQLGGKKGLDIMEVIVISLIAASLLFGLTVYLGALVLIRATLIAQVLVPFTMLIFMASKYKDGEDIKILGMPRRIICMVWVIIIAFLIQAIAKLLKEWKKGNSISSVISYGTLVCVMNFNNYSGTGQIVSTDLHHPYENIIGFSQIFELGQKPFEQYIPVSGMYSVFQGFFLWLFGKGEFAYYYVTENIYYLIISMIIIWLLKKHLRDDGVLLMATLIPIVRYNRVALIIPIMLFLAWPELIGRKNTWLKAWFLTSLLHGLYYPVFGAAVCIGFFPLGAYQLVSYIRDEFIEDRKRISFWMGWVITILPAILSMPLLLGTLKHMKAMSSQTVYADGIARFGQTVPTSFLGYIHSVGIRLLAYDSATFFVLVAIVWISAYLVIRVGGIHISDHRIRYVNADAATIASSFGIAMLVSFTYTLVRIDINRIYSRSAGIIYGSIVMIIIISTRFLKNSKAAYVFVGIAVCVVALGSGVSVFKFDSASKLQPYYTVDSDYIFANDGYIPRLGQCFVKKEVYDNVVERYDETRILDENKGYFGLGRFGHYYLSSVKGDSVMERATVKGYSAAVETIDLMRRNGSITNAVDSFTQYYLYYWLLMSGDYIWSPEEHFFYPNNGRLSVEEVRKRHKNIGLTTDDRDLGRTPSSWGSSMDSLERVFKCIPIGLDATKTRAGVTIDFDRAIKGEDADFLYLEFSDTNQKYDYILFNHSEDVVQTVSSQLSKNLMKKDYNRDCIISVFWNDDDGNQHDLRCSLGRGKLLIPLGAGRNWLLHNHSNVKITLTVGEEASTVPEIKAVNLLKVREVE